MKTVKESVVLLLSLIMIIIFAGCGNDDKYMDFMKNGWDGGTAPSETSEASEEVSDTTPKETTEKVSTTKITTTNTTTKKTTTKTTTRKVTTKTTNKTTSTKTTTAKPTSSNAMLNALDFYKASANQVKTSSKGITCTKIKEVIKEISGKIPEEYQEYGFRPGTSTEKRIYNTPTKIKSGFCVEGKDYVCDLVYSDIKSATVTTSGGNQIITICVKDDTAGTYDHSKKCVSTVNIPDGTWTCRGVIVKGTINSKGQLISLYTNVPTYVTSGSSSFAFSIEQYWTITY